MIRFRRFWKFGSAFVVVAFVVVDVLAIATEGVGATFSRYALGVASDHPIVPLAAGIVIGHLFWPQKRSDPGGE